MKFLKPKHVPFRALLITCSTLLIGMSMPSLSEAAAPKRLENGDLSFTESGSMGSVKVTIDQKSKIATANAPISAVCVSRNTGNYLKWNDANVTFAIQGPAANMKIEETVNGFYSGSHGPDYRYHDNTCYPIKGNVRKVAINLSGQFDNRYLDSIILNSVTIRGGSLNLPEDLKAAGTPILVSYQVALEKLNEFTGGIKKSDQRHVARLKQALQDAMNKFSDKDGNMTLPVTHEVVREHSRLIMVLATVLNELLVDYDDVENLKVPIEYLKSLSAQVRSAYGWNEGLAGGSSKSLAALGAVVDLEVRELYTTMAAAGVTDISSMNGLLKATHMLINRVKASNGGDAASQDVVNNFASVWNSTGVQSILAQLMNAPADVAGLIQPKLKLLFMAIESLSDLTNSGLLLPDGGSTSTKLEVKTGKKK